PVADLWGIGTKTAARLAEHGIVTVADLGHADADALAAWFGPTIGPGLRRLARGGASRTVTTEPWVRRSVSKQVTYPTDLTSREEISTAVLALLDDVHALLLAEGRVATHVAVTVRTASFRTRTRAAKLPEPTTDLAALRERAEVALARFEIERPVRLLGVRLDLAEPSPGAATVAG